MKDTTSMATMLAAAMMMGGLPGDKTPEPKKERKCLLPGCEKTTIHNGGYCCGEHCRQHRALRKSNVSK
jgi:hypothetical protein